MNDGMEGRRLVQLKDLSDTGYQLALLKNKVRREGTRVKRLLCRRERIVVSLTSYPGRIGTVHKVIRSLFAQKVLPDLVVLYLSIEEFPNREDDLPEELLACLGHDFEIRWVKGNLGSHKKYFYAFSDFPQSLIITVDDDIECRNTLVGELLEFHRRFPHAIPAIRCHLIQFDDSGHHLPYNDWTMEVGNYLPSVCGLPSMSLFATSGSGILFSPGSLPEEAFDSSAIIETCPRADDVWLKVMTAIAGWPTVSVPGWQGVVPIEGTQESSLWSVNEHGGNDDALLKVYDYCAKHLGIANLDELLQDEKLACLL